MFGCCAGLTGRRRRCSENFPKTPQGNSVPGEPLEQRGLRLTIPSAAPYVGRMTRAANEGQRHACQGLHKGSVLAYGSSRTVRLTVAGHFTWPVLYVLPPRREDECIGYWPRSGVVSRRRSAGNGLG